MFDIRYRFKMSKCFYVSHSTIILLSTFKIIITSTINASMFRNKCCTVFRFPFCEFYIVEKIYLQFRTEHVIKLDKISEVSSKNGNSFSNKNPGFL